MADSKNDVQVRMVARVDGHTPGTVVSVPPDVAERYLVAEVADDNLDAVNPLPPEVPVEGSAGDAAPTAPDAPPAGSKRKAS